MSAYLADYSLNQYVTFWKESAFPGLEILEDHFREGVPPDQMPALFKKMVKCVWVEVFAYCNRKCFFCPNASGARSAQRHLPPEIYTRIIQELKSIKYDGLFAFHEYNEPLSDRVIVDRIAECRDALPKTRRVITTNGDYLDKDYMEDLYQAGLKHMNISIYGPNQGEFVDDYIVDRIKKLCAKIGMECEFARADKGYSYVVHTGYKDMSVVLKGNNLGKYGFDRAGAYAAADSHNKTRVAPCYAPFYEFHVEASGYVKPCCNIYTDKEDHKKYIIGSVHDGKTIFEHYFSHMMVQWRKSLHVMGEKEDPCKTCSWPWI